MSCRSVLSTTKSFKKSLVSSINTFKIRTISTLLTDNIVEDHHLIVEMNIRIIVETTITQTIDEMNFEVNFEIKMINFKIDVQKDVLYVRNLIVDQSIIQKTSATTQKSVFRLDTHSSGTIIVFVSVEEIPRG